MLRKKLSLLIGLSILSATLAQPAWAVGPIACKVAAESTQVDDQATKDLVKDTDKKMTDAKPMASNGQALHFVTEFDIESNKGKTFFSMLKDVIKPSLDGFAKQGFTIADENTVAETLANVSSKVQGQAMKAAGSKENLLKIVTALRKSTAGKKITFYDLPNLIAATKIPCDRFGLTTFIALASGGGTAIRLDEKNIFFNVNYGAGDVAKDEMTGRSFAANGQHAADDISDKSLLSSLQALVQDPKEDLNAIYTSLVQILVDCDTSGFKTLSPAGQSVLGDFLAIYTAEGTRHLMNGLKSHAWDDAELQVTLLAGFHAGQKDLMVMFNSKLTDTVPNQGPGGSVRNQMRKAALIDYWQFSSNADPKFRNRSGINVTRKDFNLLGQYISDYMRANHADLVANVERHFEGVKTGGNIYSELPQFLINFKTPATLTDASGAFVDDLAKFLKTVNAEANQITTEILAKPVPVKTISKPAAKAAAKK